MRANQFLTLAIAAFTMLSCTNEEPPAEPKAGRSKLSITIKGEAEAPKGRAAGVPTPAEESKVNNFIVFVFKANGDNDMPPTEYTSVPANNKIAEVEITVDAKEVYIIANTASAATTNTALKAVKKKSELQAIMGRGFAGPSPTALVTQTSTNLWMSGKNDVAFTPQEGKNVSITVTLKYVAAKVRITSVTVDATKVPDLATDMKMKEVIVLNGGTATRFIPADGATSLIPTYIIASDGSDAFYTGGFDLGASSFVNKPTKALTNNNYVYTLDGDFKIETQPVPKNQHYFYVFENDGLAFDEQPTIVTLKVTGKNFVEYYYSVFFKMDSALPTLPEGYDNKVIERGNSYDIALTIKKWGSPDPTIPALKTTVDVTITPATWQTVIVSKTFE